MMTKLQEVSQTPARSHTSTSCSSCCSARAHSATELSLISTRTHTTIKNSTQMHSIVMRTTRMSIITLAALSLMLATIMTKVQPRATRCKCTQMS